MKLTFTTLFAVMVLAVTGQNTSTINFVTNRCQKGSVFTIYLNDQMAGTVMTGENLEYKLFSQGRIIVGISIGGYKLTKFIDVKRGNVYYFEINNFPGRYEQIDEAKGKEYFAKNTNTIKAEESHKNPIVIGKDGEDEGPKQGTCFLISKKGYFLTNYHVISGAENVQIKGIGGDFSSALGADVIAVDVDLDMALLKLKNQTITFDSVPYKFSLESAQQGTKSYVLGYPLTSAMGEEIKITEGIISAKSGYKGSVSQYQFSAAVQPGNSGSPLFNENGDVIGVINAKLFGAEGAGYAIKSQYLPTFFKLIESIQIENTKTTISNLSLADKITKLKNYIFIVKTE